MSVYNCEHCDKWLDNDYFPAEFIEDSKGDEKPVCEDCFVEYTEEWYEKLDPNDNQTWVMCYVSYDNPYECDEVVWIGKHKADDVYPFGLAGSWRNQFFRYATPVDLNIRYKGDKP